MPRSPQKIFLAINGKPNRLRAWFSLAEAKAAMEKLGMDARFVTYDRRIIKPRGRPCLNR